MPDFTPLSRSAQEIVAKLGARLTDDFSHQLLDGAVRVLGDRKNVVRLSQFANTFRELCTHILHTLAPSTEVRRCVWFPEERAKRAKNEPHAIPAALDQPTRRQRAMYATQGGLTDKQLTEFKVDVDDLHDDFLEAFELLNKLTHVKPDTIVTDENEVTRFVEEAISGLAGFYDVLDHCRETISEAIVNAVHDQAFEELTREAIEELDLLSTRTYIEGSQIEEIEIVRIDATAIHYRVTGIVEVELNYGSSSDRDKGDGASMDDSYPFAMAMTAPVANPRKFEGVVCSVDTSSFYE